ncbi:MAG TPA: STAS/SEC14 domain-containing protein [Dinghuibacter sp.]|uniref:STAS/SEC14 domain-containing protein n=1 Tax=Dinghuibacter sp. TaxID=2024697 RepID=UPI002C1372F5|nr:STAS/SEC14 domain-containing protein [Dinghuibacter sp.]HTJ14240.1 STAS/SEC14 domain-containing protein [Dinghuibacter sp.]
MIEQLHDTPDNVIAFRATGEVTKEDYDRIVFPKVDTQTDEHKPLNYVFVVDTPLKNFTAAAWMRDAWLGLKEIARWHRVAIVSDQEGVRNFTNTVGHFVPGEYKGFHTKDLTEAIAWASAWDKSGA